MMARCLTITTTVLMLAGCGAKPIETVRSGNPEIEAGLIAQIEGCNLYRLTDGGHRVYLTVCPASSSRTSWQETCGKGCVEDYDALTVRRGGI